MEISTGWLVAVAIGGILDPEFGFIILLVAIIFS